MKRYVMCCLLVLVGGTLLLTSSPVMAAQPKGGPPRGLSITPVRQYITLPAGTAKKSNITVGNHTDKPMTVEFSVKQFSVADYSYDFAFNEVVGTKLITLSAPATLLQPGESRTVPYEVNVPTASTPGGRYYTIFASATVNGTGGSLNEQIQAASLVYITVDGKLTYTNNIGAVSMRRLVFGSSIPFSMDVSNTGNTHYFMYLTASLHGPLTTKSQVSESHLLLPIKTRHLNSSLPSPVLPGIYRASYGYRTEYTPNVVRNAWVIFIPPWSIALLLVLVWLSWHIYRRWHSKPQQPASPVEATD